MNFSLALAIDTVGLIPAIAARLLMGDDMVSSTCSVIQEGSIHYHMLTFRSKSGIDYEVIHNPTILRLEMTLRKKNFSDGDLNVTVAGEEKCGSLFYVIPRLISGDELPVNIQRDYS